MIPWAYDPEGVRYVVDARELQGSVKARPVRGKPERLLTVTDEAPQIRTCRRLPRGLISPKPHLKYPLFSAPCLLIRNGEMVFELDMPDYHIWLHVHFFHHHAIYVTRYKLSCHISVGLQRNIQQTCMINHN